MEILFGIAVMVMLANLVRGGILYITSNGDAEKVETAKSTITATVAGMVLVGVVVLGG